MTNVKHLTPEELAERWNCSGETLARWRSEGQGCRWMRIGGYIRYRMTDVEAHEAQCLRKSTSERDLSEVVA